MACCPPGSEPYLAAEYTTKGEKKSIEGCEFYCTGVPGEGKKGIILVPDIWGWNSGRTRNFADLMAEKGYFCAVPKILEPCLEGGTDGDGLPPDFDLATRGAEMGPWIKPITWDGTVKPRMQALLGFMKAQKVTTLGMMGFCYGAYPCCKTVADKSMWKDIGLDITTIVAPHPSIQISWAVYEEDKAWLSGVDRPVLLIPAGNDGDDYRPGGEIFELLKAADPSGKTKTMATEFANVKHGWSVRGDVSDSTVKAKVGEFLSAMQGWFAEHMPP